MQMVYLDNAATTQPLPCAVASIRAAIDTAWGNPNSSHGFGLGAREILEQARKKIARCINAYPSEIYFTDSATTSCQWAREIIRKNCYAEIINPTEHHAVLDFFEPTLYNADITSKGFIQMLANNETGEIYSMPKRENKFDIIFSDATAAMGHIPIDVKKLGVDLLAAGGHKFGALCGVGFLYVKDGVFTHVHGRKLGTPPVALITAMAEALEWKINHMEDDTEHINNCYDALYDGLLHGIGGWKMNTPNKRLPHILNVSFDGVNGKALAMLLSKEGVMVSAGAACTSGNNEPSHVLMSMFNDEDRARSAIRISLSSENTIEECVKASRVIVEGVRFLRDVAANAF